MMGVLGHMQATFEEWGERKVRLLSIPLPPIAIRGLVYRPDAFASSTFDNTQDLNDTIGKATTAYKTVAVRPTKNGPAILIVTKLKELIQFDSGTGFLTVQRRSVCASVSYQVKFDLKDGRGNPLDYAHNVTLKALNFSASCNPGSHLVVPDAPYLSALLQYAASPKEGGSNSKIIKRVTYLTPDEGVAAFLGYDFSANRSVDGYIASCAAHPGVRYHHNSEGVGDWVVGYLNRLRHNRYTLEGIVPPKEPDNEFTTSGLPIILDPSQENGRGNGDGADRGRLGHPIREERDQDYDRYSAVLGEGRFRLPSLPRGEAQSQAQSQADGGQGSGQADQQQVPGGTSSGTGLTNSGDGEQ
jgi:hypothetical protein